MTTETIKKEDIALTYTQALVAHVAPDEGFHAALANVEVNYEAKTGEMKTVATNGRLLLSATQKTETEEGISRESFKKTIAGEAIVKSLKMMSKNKLGKKIGLKVITREKDGKKEDVISIGSNGVFSEILATATPQKFPDWENVVPAEDEKAPYAVFNISNLKQAIDTLEKMGVQIVGFQWGEKVMRIEAEGTNGVTVLGAIALMKKGEKNGNKICPNESETK